jgi:hypothetical protein
MFIMFQIKNPPGMMLNMKKAVENENYLPLCFSSFELLKVNNQITEEVGNYDYIHNETVLHEKVFISEEDQQPSRAFNDRVVDYMERYFSLDLQPMLNYQLGNKDDGQST